MTTEEVFTALMSHTIEGIMFHEEMSEYYLFLGLKGYYDTHRKHAERENDMRHKIIRYYMCKCNKLLEQTKIDEPDIIPQNWYKYTRQNVDANTKRNSVRAGIEKWVDWERETNKMLNEMYYELIQISDIESARFVEELLEANSTELRKAEEKHLNLVSSDYNMTYVLSEQ